MPSQQRPAAAGPYWPVAAPVDMLIAAAATLVTAHLNGLD